MKRTHALAISLLLAVAVVAGGYAAYETAGLGSSSQAATTSSDAAVAAKKAQLDELEQSIQAALERRPPELPPLVRRDQPATSNGDQVVYVEAPATTAAASPHEDDDDYEHESEGESEGDLEHEGGEDD